MDLEEFLQAFGKLWEAPHLDETEFCAELANVMKVCGMMNDRGAWTPAMKELMEGEDG